MAAPSLRILQSFHAVAARGKAVYDSFTELYTSLQSTQGVIELPASSFYLATGAPLAVFSGGASAVPGSEFTGSEAFGIRWNNNATLDGVVTSRLVPPDMDITANATLVIHAAKIGATPGDLPTFDATVFNQPVGALYDADATYGGTTSAMTNAATKTVQSVTLTLALANLAAFPARFSLSIKPTDGTLGTDDLLMTGAHILYTKKLLAS